MRQDVKELADAMEKGWKLCPKMVNVSFYTGDRKNPTACCARGHAALGKYGDASRVDRSWDNDFHILWSQHVKFSDHTDRLAYAINDLVDLGWTTPQVVAWLRTHLED